MRDRRARSHNAARTDWLAADPERMSGQHFSVGSEASSVTAAPDIAIRARGASPYSSWTFVDRRGRSDTPAIDVLGRYYVTEASPGVVGLYERGKGLQATLALHPK